MGKEIVKNIKCDNNHNQVIKFFVSILFFSFLLIVSSLHLGASEVDLSQFDLPIARVESIKGEAFVIRDSTNSEKMSKDDLIISKNITNYIENIDNRDTSDGRVEISEDIIFKTGEDSQVKIVLEDLMEESTVLLIGPETELELAIKGGYVFASKYSHEGYDPKTLAWRELSRKFDFVVKKGKVRINGAPNGNFKITTKNTKLISCEYDKNLDYEIEVLTGEDALNKDQGIESDNNTIQMYIDMILKAYNIENLDELDDVTKKAVEETIAGYQEAMGAAESNDNPFVNSGRIVTIFRVYGDKMYVEGADLKKGEMVTIKGDMGIAVKGKISE